MPARHKHSSEEDIMSDSISEQGEKFNENVRSAFKIRGLELDRRALARAEAILQELRVCNTEKRRRAFLR